MMPEAAMWPQGDMWGLHDFSLHGAQGGAVVPRADRQELRRREQRRGLGDAGAVRQLRRLPRHVRGAEQEPHGPADLDEPSLLAVVRLADLRLLPRADGRLLRRQEGVASRCTSSGIRSTDNVEVVNYSGGDARGLTASVELLNMDGAREVGEVGRASTARKTAWRRPFKMEYPAGLTPVHFIRLKLTRGGETGFRELLLARRSRRAITGRFATLPKVKLDADDARRAAGRPLAADHRAAQSVGQPGADGAVESGAGEEPATASCPRSTATTTSP